MTAFERSLGKCSSGLRSTVPSRKIVHPAGQPISKDLEEMLGRYFADTDLRRLERLGGRVVVSITAPFTSRKRDRERAPVDEEFIERLLSASQSSEQLQHMIRDLTVKELRELAKKMGQPVRSKDTAEEIRSELIRFIQARDVWHKISGTARTD